MGLRVAVFVVYQPEGLAASTLLTLDHLKSSGYAPLVIANSRLSPSDRDDLLARSAGLIERANLGYDFGAYRDGILHLLRLGRKLDRLVLVNDSTWFPLRAADDTLARLEQLGVDVAGHIYKTESAERQGRDHLESHLLSIGPRTLQSPAFQKFWRSYRLSNERVTTITRGEKGFTQAMQRAGLSVRGLLSRERLLALLGDLDDADLRAMAKATLHHRDDARQHWAAILSRPDDGWREAWLGWVSDALSSSRQHLLSASFFEPAVLLGGMGFVKKAADPRFALARERILELEAAGRIAPLHPQVRLEIAASTRRLQTSAQGGGGP